MEMEKLIKIAKTMKRDYMVVCPFVILGSDCNYCTLSVIEMDTGSNDFATISSDLVTPQNMEKYASSHPAEYYNEYRDIGDGYKVNAWVESTLRQNIFPMYNRIVNFLQTHKPVYAIGGLENEQEFMNKVAKLKVADGMTRYFFNNTYLITSFSKVHAINASDKVSVSIYEYDQDSYLYEFLVDKKKYVVKEYLRYRKF